MNNFVLHGRSAATATAAAFMLAGHAAQAEVARPAKEFHSIIRSLQTEGSLLGQSTKNAATSNMGDAMGQFASAASDAFQALARAQVRLDPIMAKQLAEHAWDLYDEA